MFVGRGGCCREIGRTIFRAFCGAIGRSAGRTIGRTIGGAMGWTIGRTTLDSRGKRC